MTSTEGLFNRQKAARATQRIDPCEMQSPISRKALAAWARLRGKRRFPSRKNITPKELGSLLRNTALVRVIDGGREFEFRILGDAVVQAGPEIESGMTTAELDQKFPGFGKTLRSIYKAVCRDGAPRAYRGLFERNDGHAYFHESLVLPLGAEDTAVDHLLVIGIYAPLSR